jgi:hypothetical protein
MKDVTKKCFQPSSSLLGGAALLSVAALMACHVSVVQAAPANQGYHPSARFPGIMVRSVPERNGAVAPQTAFSPSVAPRVLRVEAGKTKAGGTTAFLDPDSFPAEIVGRDAKGKTVVKCVDGKSNAARQRALHAKKSLHKSSRLGLAR